MRTLLPTGWGRPWRAGCMRAPPQVGHDCQVITEVAARRAASRADLAPLLLAEVVHARGEPPTKPPELGSLLIEDGRLQACGPCTALCTVCVIRHHPGLYCCECVQVCAAALMCQTLATYLRWVCTGPGRAP